MLKIYMGEGENETVIFSPLLGRDVHHICKRKHMGKEFKMIEKLGKYEMEGIILDLGSKVKNFPKKSWDLMGKPKLV
jgi:hypothetical protein